MLQAAARDDVARFCQRLDDGIVGVALVAVFFQHALAFKARRGFRQHAIGVDGERDGRVDVAIAERFLVLGPDDVVVGAVARRGVDEARARIVGDVIAVEQRHVESVAEIAQRMLAYEVTKLEGADGRRASR